MLFKNTFFFQKSLLLSEKLLPLHPLSRSNALRRHLRKSSLKELHKQRSSSTRSDWFTFVCYQLGRRNEPSLCCFAYCRVIRETFESVFPLMLDDIRKRSVTEILLFFHILFLLVIVIEEKQIFYNEEFDPGSG